MLWLKELILILALGSFSVLAEHEGAAEEMPRVLSAQDFKFFIKPLNFFNAQNTQSTNTEIQPPATVLIKPALTLPFYPNYQLLSNNKRPAKKPNRPNKVTKPVYYPWTYPAQTLHPTQQPPYVIVLALPATSNKNNDSNGNKGKKGKKGKKGNKNNKENNDSSRSYENSHDSDTRYLLGDSNYPFEELTQDYESLGSAADNENENYDYEIDTDDRSTNVNENPLANDSTEDSDTISVDTKDIKLPFGIQLSSRPMNISNGSDNKMNNQEALIYLKNFKKGRQLESDETA